MHEYQLKTGEKLTIVEAEPEDAKELIALVKSAAAESQFLTFESQEFTMTIEQEQKLLSETKASKNQIYLLAKINQKIVGLLFVSAAAKKRIQHIGEISITISKANWNKGIGQHLMQQMISWATENSIVRKLNLAVNSNNHGAIHLYKKMGFKQEGLSSRGSFLDGEFVDLVLMGLDID